MNASPKSETKHAKKSVLPESGAQPLTSRVADEPWALIGELPTPDLGRLNDRTTFELLVHFIAPMGDGDPIADAMRTVAREVTAVRALAQDEWVDYSPDIALLLQCTSNRLEVIAEMQRRVTAARKAAG